MEKGQQNPGVILGRLVRAAREEKHMSVNALSRASSISPRTIRTIEGENPSGSKPLTVVCLATALEADLDSWTKELGISIFSGVRQLARRLLRPVYDNVMYRILTNGHLKVATPGLSPLNEFYLTRFELAARILGFEGQIEHGAVGNTRMMLHAFKRREYDVLLGAPETIPNIVQNYDFIPYPGLRIGLAAMYISGHMGSGRTIRWQDIESKTLDDVVAIVSNGDVAHLHLRNICEYDEGNDLVAYPESGIAIEQYLRSFQIGQPDKTVVLVGDEIGIRSAALRNPSEYNLIMDTTCRPVYRLGMGIRPHSVELMEWLKTGERLLYSFAPNHALRAYHAMICTLSQTLQITEVDAASMILDANFWEDVPDQRFARVLREEFYLAANHPA